MDHLPASRELTDLDILVGTMSTADVARAANDRIDTGLLIKPGLRAVTDRCERLLTRQLGQNGR